jgi:hypothetical protein
MLALVLLAASPQPAPTPAARFEAANQAYLSGDFLAAAQGYQELLADGWESPSLHVNLGNARFRMGKRGLAAASYSRALRLDPGDADARTNLDLVRSLNVDQVVGAEARPLVVRALERVPDGLAIGAFALAWLALWGGLAGRRFAPAGLRHGVAAVAFAAALGAAATGAVLAGKAAARGTPTAVIVASTAPVREGAEAALRPAFELHEGTEVRVLEVRAGFVRVRLGNGLEGWVSAGDLEPV